MEIPFAAPTPIVDRLDPALRHFVLLPVFVGEVALDLKDDGRSVGHADQEVGLIVVLNAEIRVWNDEIETFISGVEVDYVSCLLQPESC